MDFSNKGYKLVYEENFDSVDALKNWGIIEEVKDTRVKQSGEVIPSHVADFATSKSDGSKLRYRKENVKIENEMLVLTCNETEEGYEGAMLKEKTVPFKYGYIEARICYPQIGKGIWPLFTLECGDEELTTIFDIATMLGDKNKTACNMHSWYKRKDSNLIGHTNYLFSRNNAYPRFFPDELCEDTLQPGFHTYGMERTDKDVIFYCDGNEICHVDVSCDVFKAFDQEGYAKLSLSVGLPEIDAPDDNTVLPAEMKVDYIKYYKLER